MPFASASLASVRWRIRWWRCKSSQFQAPSSREAPIPFDSRFRRWQGVGSILTEIGRSETVRFHALGEFCWKTMAELAGNLLVAQSGGPTAVINASVAGIILEAGRHPDQLEQIYGGL